MKILFTTQASAPDIGGLETVAGILADHFVALGHEVRLVTQSLARASDPPDGEQFRYPVIRRPGLRQLRGLARWCDVYYQHNISLNRLWPALLVPRPWVFSLVTWLTRPDGRISWRDRLKKLVLRCGETIVVSHAMADLLPVPSIVIGNPYDDTLFRELADVPRTRDIVFLARLVSDKGGDLMLDAMAILKRDGLRPTLTVVGKGPELEPLRRQAQALDLTGQVEFAGTQTGETLVRTLNAHRIMAVPSRLPEPFGVVALEGIACGNLLVGSERGGLSDAIGPCGLTFPNGDADALAKCLGRLLLDPELGHQLRGRAAAHLQQHHPRKIAEAYLRVFEEAKRRCS